MASQAKNRYYAFRLGAGRVVLWSPEVGEVGETLVSGSFEKVKAAVDAIVQWEIGGDVRWEFVSQPKEHHVTCAYFAKEEPPTSEVEGSLCDGCVLSPTCVVAVNAHQLGLGLIVTTCQAHLEVE